MSDVDAERPGSEVERKFLVCQLPGDEPAENPTSIHQGYIAVGTDGTEVRLRRKGDRLFQTVKRGEGLNRLETEVEVSERQFDLLWPHTEGRRVKKDRYEIPYRGSVIELDVFHGALEGLIIAEVEFASVEDSHSFEPPSWFGEEVTNDERYLNRSLALRGRPKRPD